MYSGTTLTRLSGRVLGAHQKIDRVARRQLGKLVPDQKLFPTSRRILHFEGFHGPDAIKRKSPAKDEPWHYFNPFDDKDKQLLELIDGHYNQLVKELKTGNQERVAFEAAWLAHALVDGLTPAHHFPYEEKLMELMGGESIETRTSILKKSIMPGVTVRQRVKNNWEMWGAKGLLMTHWWFEIGVSALIAPLSFSEVLPTKADVAAFQKKGIQKWFRETAREVAVLDMYENYYRKGWTPRLAYQVRHRLGPTLIKTVTLSWYGALIEAGLVTP